MKVPTVFPPTGTYPAGTEISVATSDPDAVIYFTLDGSPPSSASLRYREPLRLDADTTDERRMRLRAIAASPDRGESPVAAADFERASGIAVRFRKPGDWSWPHIHYWNTIPDGLSTRWPGQKMSLAHDGWYRFELPGQTSANLVFSDGGGAQSDDLTVETADAWFIENERWTVDPSRLSRFLFPGGFSKALVLSMDDGPVQDRRLVELLNRHGIRGTFHLNSGRLGQPGHLSPDEVVSLYAGHEVSTHSVSHPYLDSLARGQIAAELEGDHSALSRMLGRDPRGHAYPFGAYNAEVVEVLRELGIAYARTARSTGAFRLPGDPLVWNPTCHHSAAGGLVDTFFARPDCELSLFFIYGHSWELDAEEPTNGWGYMEELAQRLGGRSDLWYTTAIEVADYTRTMCALRPSLRGDSLYNSGDVELWLRSGQSVFRLPAGARAETAPNP